MDVFYQIAGTAVLCAVLCTVLRRSNSAWQGAAVLLFAVLALAAAIRLLEPVAQLVRELCSLSGMGQDYLEPVLKVCAIGLVAQLAATACTEAGAPTLAHVTQLCGCAASLYLLIPLLRAVLALVQELMGG